MLFLFISLSAWSDIAIYPISLANRYQSDLNNKMIVRTVSAPSLFYTFESYQIGIQLLSWTSNNDDSYTQIQEIWKLSKLYGLYQVAGQKEGWQFWAGFFLGQYTIDLKTHLFDTFQEDSSGPIMFGGGLLSVNWIYSYFITGLDFQLELGKDFLPNPTPSATLKVGFKF